MGRAFEVKQKTFPQVSKKLSFTSLCLLFYIIFIYFFTKRKPFKNYAKCFLFHLKRYFSSGDIETFFPFISQFSDSKGKMEVE